MYSFGRKDFSDGSKSEIMHKMRVIRITERVVKIANLFTDMKVLSAAQSSAATVLKDDPTLSREENKYLKEHIARFLKKTYN